MANEGGDLVNSAIKRGLASVVKNHPRFKGDKSYLLRHLDEERIDYEMQHINHYIAQEQERRGVEFSDSDKSQIIYAMLSQGAAFGRLFDEAGKEVILRQSLEEKAARGPRRRESHELLKGEKYLDHALGAFRDLYEMMKTGDYAHHMPKLAQAITTIYNLGFLSSSVELLRHYGLINEKRYELIKKNIHSGAQRGIEETKEAITEYSGISKSGNENGTPNGTIKERRLRDYAERAASIILAAAGFGFLISNSGMTGGAIGATNSSSPFLGLLLIAAGIGIFILNKRREK